MILKSAIVNTTVGESYGPFWPLTEAFEWIYRVVNVGNPALRRPPNGNLQIG
jgi:hypothetical protein